MKAEHKVQSFQHVERFNSYQTKSNERQRITYRSRGAVLFDYLITDETRYLVLLVYTFTSSDPRRHVEQLSLPT
jgi:hypothetical protein